MERYFLDFYFSIVHISSNNVLGSLKLCMHVSNILVEGTVSQILFPYPSLETEYRLFPPVTIFLDLFPRAGYFFNGSDWDQRSSKSLIILYLSGDYSK